MGVKLGYSGLDGNELKRIFDVMLKISSKRSLRVTLEEKQLSYQSLTISHSKEMIHSWLDQVPLPLLVISSQLQLGIKAKT